MNYWLLRVSLLCLASTPRVPSTTAGAAPYFRRDAAVSRHVSAARLFRAVVRCQTFVISAAADALWCLLWLFQAHKTGTFLYVFVQVETSVGR